MTVLPIVRFPSPGLKTVCSAIDVFDENLRTLAKDLLETMRAVPGVGITAAHVGIFQRLTVIELNGPESTRVYVNPEITWASSELSRNVEGSVSMPGATDEVERPKAIRFRYQDLDGAVHEEEASDFLAICIQHEIDQLDGIFWLQRLSRLKRERLIRKWEKMQP